MHRLFASLALALSVSSFTALGHAQTTAAQPGEDLRGPLIGGAAFSTGILAFEVMLVTSFPGGEFGPRPLLETSLVLASVGALGAHVSVIALLVPEVFHDRRRRALFTGLAIFSEGLSLLAFSPPTGFAVTSMPLDGEEAIAVVTPFLLGAIGLVAMGGGIAVMADAAREEPSVVVRAGASTDGASIAILGRF